MFKKLLVFSLAIVTLLAAGCGGKDAIKEAAIKVGATAGPHAEVVEAAARKPLKMALRYRLWSFLIISLLIKPWPMAKLTL